MIYELRVIAASVGCRLYVGRSLADAIAYAREHEGDVIACYKDMSTGIQTYFKFFFTPPRAEYNYRNFFKALRKKFLLGVERGVYRGEYLEISIQLTRKSASAGGYIPPAPSKNYMYFEAVQANSTISMDSTMTTAPQLEYSLDGVTFAPWAYTTSGGVHTYDVINLGNIGDKVYFRGINNSMSIDATYYSNFILSGSVKSGGSVMSLIDNNGFTTEILSNGCFRNLFYGCTSLTSAPELPATTLSANCYLQMFRGCSSLNDVTVFANSWDVNNTTNWLYNVSPSGILRKPAGTNIPAGASGIPNGWTVIDF